MKSFKYKNNNYLDSSGIMHNRESLKNILSSLYKYKILYSNASGSNGEITLSDSVASYKKIKIYYRNDLNIINSQEFDNCNNQDVSLFMAVNRSDLQASWMQTSRRHVAANKITVVYSTEIKISNNGTIGVNTGNYIYITKVEGYY